MYGFEADLPEDWGRRIDEAPRDAWILIGADPDRGGELRIGRWAPKYYPETRCTYDWEVINPDGSTNHWADGYAYQWKPLSEVHVAFAGEVCAALTSPQSGTST